MDNHLLVLGIIMLVGIAMLGTGLTGLAVADSEPASKMSLDSSVIGGLLIILAAIYGVRHVKSGYGKMLA